MIEFDSLNPYQNMEVLIAEDPMSLCTPPSTEGCAVGQPQGRDPALSPVPFPSHMFDDPAR